MQQFLWIKDPRNVTNFSEYVGKNMICNLLNVAQC